MQICSFGSAVLSFASRAMRETMNAAADTKTMQRSIDRMLILFLFDSSPPNRRVLDGARETAATPKAAAASPRPRPAMGKYDETMRNSKEWKRKEVWGRVFLMLMQNEYVELVDSIHGFWKFFLCV